MNGISALMKEARENSLVSSAMRVEFEVCSPEEGPHLTLMVYALISDRKLPGLQTLIFFVYKPPCMVLYYSSPNRLLSPIFAVPWFAETSFQSLPELHKGILPSA